MATNDDSIKRTIQIELATLSNPRDVNSSMWLPQGQHVTFTNNETGVFKDTYALNAKPDLSGVVLGRGIGYARFSIADASDPRADKAVEAIYQVQKPVIVTFRERVKDDQGQYVPTRTITLWGFIASQNVGEPGPGSIGISVHAKSEISQDDYGTEASHFDLYSGAVNGERKPTSIPVYGAPDGENFAAPELEYT